MEGIHTLDQYLERYAPLLGLQANQTLVPLHVPSRDPPLVVETKRKPRPAQAHVITAAVKTLRRQNAVLLGANMGTGKTLMGCTTAHAHAAGKPYTGLVMCPGQLVPKWRRELLNTLPGIEVRVINKFRDVLRLKTEGRPSPPTWWVVSRDRAKLGAKWRAAYLKRRDGTPICPRCGSPIVDPNKGTPISHAKLSKKRHYCQAELVRADGTLARDECGQPMQCNEPLWTFTRKINRWEPARFIKKHLPHFFDYFIVDEVHQEKGAQTAQANAFGSLAAAARKTIALTGTLIGGYAEHVRPLLFRLAPQSLIAEGLGWKDHLAFNQRYGRIETRIIEKDGGEGDDNDQSRGQKSKTIKNVKPGIMPTLFGRHLLDKCLFLSLEEVADDLPPLDEFVVPVNMDDEQQAAYEQVEDDLAQAIRQMVRRGDKRLLAKMLATLLGYPDHPYDFGDIGYRSQEGFRHVTTCPDLGREVVRPKEQALLDLVARERAEGRQVWVYLQMTGKRDVQLRLEQLLTQAGHRVNILRAKVPQQKREPWIAKHGPGTDAMLSNPQLVETGFDFFDHATGHNFSTIVFYETGYNLFTMRQAGGRSWRIGQTKPCRNYYLYYRTTMQDRAMTLMGRKLAAAVAIEGKFTNEGLAALAGDDASVEMELARSLADRLDDTGAERVWGKVASERSTGCACEQSQVGSADIGFDRPLSPSAAATPRGLRLLWDDDDRTPTPERVTTRQPAERRSSLALFD
ncbi:MAG TPA: helicase-related protein [Pirellulales bacterium]|nr:helicase-related protein [Pirellulales bacterium]